MSLQTGSSSTELDRYAAHASVLTQAIAFLTQITQTVVLYVTITGGAWAVVSSNTIGAGSATLMWILVLHIAVSFGIALGLWGLGNNFIQRLNFAQWLGREYWPSIGEMGRDAWRGPPPPRAEVLPRWMPDDLRRVDRWIRYTSPTWPSLRHQRLWFVVPVLAAAVSVGLLIDVVKDREQRNKLCLDVARTLNFPDAAPLDRVVFDRARYVFDKAGCPQLLLADKRSHS